MTGSTTLERARDLLNRVGYDDHSVQSAFPVWIPERAKSPRSSTRRGRGFVEVAGVVAFTQREPKDMSTAAVVFHERGDEPALQAARALGAPFTITPDAEGLRVCVADGERLQHLRTVSNLTDDLSGTEIEFLLRPEAASRIKVGLRQLPLFEVPVNLLKNAHAGSTECLGPIVGRALSEADGALAAAFGIDEARVAEAGRLDANRDTHRGAARLVVGALAALFLWDSRRLGSDGDSRSRSTADELIHHATRTSGESFEWLHGLAPDETAVLHQLIDQLGIGVNYRSLDPSVLCHVYELALVAEDRRRELGIYYTPPGLARRMLDSLPVEFIDPTERRVLDPTCGSGTLLIAAHERLSGLQPAGWSLEERHQDLRVLLNGNDIDPFASEIARLSMLLKAQPAGNGWSITCEDALLSAAPAVAPRIIVMNPPWRYTSGSGEREQLADRFVRLALEWLAPGGLLGAVVPTSWLSADNSARTRDRLSEQYEVFELWRLPERTFTRASQAASVLLARRKNGKDGGGNRVVRQVWNSERESFLNGEPPTSNLIVSSVSSPVADVLPPLKLSEPHQRLDEVALTRSGPQPLSKAELEERGDAPASNSSRPVWYLNEFDNVQPYAEVELDALEPRRFPDDFAGNRGAGIIDLRKVLVSAARSANSPWRFRVAVDLLRVACRNSIRGIAPHDQSDDDLLFALLAIFGTGFASAYVASHGVDRNIPAPLMHGFPVPTSNRSIRRLGELGRMASRNAHDPKLLARILDDTETQVWSAYGTSPEFQSQAQRLLAQHLAPDGSVRYPMHAAAETPSTSTMRRFGSIHAIEGAQARICINGVTDSDGELIDIPARMPGWMVRSGATFDAHGIESMDDVLNADFRFQRMSWRTFGRDIESIIGSDA